MQGYNIKGEYYEFVDKYIANNTKIQIKNNKLIYSENVKDLFVDIEPLEIPSDAILLDNSYCVVINKNNKDKGQRMACGCMKSKDIGEYNTCPHLCEYCYANASKEVAVAN